MLSPNLKQIFMKCCCLEQDVDSKDWTQGAVVSLVLDENERECKYLCFFILINLYFFLSNLLNIRYFSCF